MTDSQGEMITHWERSAPGWERRAGQIRDMGMPVSVWMIDQLALQPGHRVLELAAGPGDTGFLAAEMIAPGALLCTDASDAMLEIAHKRAARLGVENVEFRRLELEWIDLPTASVDAILCRWGLMLSADPSAALSEMRRVLRPGGRTSLAVWDEPIHNPWATIPAKTLVELGHAPPPDPDAPGMFALAGPGRLKELIESAGFGEVVVAAVELVREHANVDEYVELTRDLSLNFREVVDRLAEDELDEVRSRIAALAAPFTADDGTLRLPGRSLAATANA